MKAGFLSHKDRVKLYKRFLQPTHEVAGRLPDGPTISVELHHVHAPLPPLAAGHEERALSHAFSDLALIQPGLLASMAQLLKEDVVLARKNGLGYGGLTRTGSSRWEQGEDKHRFSIIKNR